MIGQKENRLKDSGSSEIIGFLIITAIMLAGIGMVILYCYPALIQEQRSANNVNMLRTLLILQSDLKSLTQKTIPYQETLIHVGGGTLLIMKDPTYTGSKITFGLNVLPDANSTMTFLPGELKFTSHDGMTAIGLENGAVYIGENNNPASSYMLAEPSWFFDTVTKTYVFNIIRLSAKSDLAQTNVGRVRMVMNESPTTTIIKISSPTEMKVTWPESTSEIKGAAWKNYFDNSDLQLIQTSVNTSSVTYTLDPAAEKMVIREYNVTILSL